MGFLHQINEWSNKHHPKWLVVLRVGLGLCLLLKGLQFIQNAALFELLLAQTSVAQNISWLNTFIPWLHLIGGIMIIIGLFTRLSALLQIPILTGAVFFIHSKQGIFGAESGLLFSIIVLLLLLFFLLEGGGPFSFDNFFRKPEK